MSETQSESLVKAIESVLGIHEMTLDVLRQFKEKIDVLESKIVKLELELKSLPDNTPLNR